MLPSGSPSIRADQRTRLVSNGETRILIVDRDPKVGLALSFMLSVRRFEQVRCVRSTERAVAISKQFQAEIAFLDLELPQDGYLAVARQLSRDARNHELRLIALAGSAGHPARSGARAAGFERFLAKPVSNQELDEVLGVDRTAPYPGILSD